MIPNLDDYGADLLDKRTAIGKQAIDLALDEADSWHGDDEPLAALETAAADVISDILTALFGPEGFHDHEGRYQPNAEAHDKAQAMLDRAMDSYTGDAEDYTTEDD
jgi:hypothetical protein